MDVPGGANVGVIDAANAGHLWLFGRGGCWYLQGKAYCTSILIHLPGLWDGVGMSRCHYRSTLSFFAFFEWLSQLLGR
jgi:hypothetical protein